MNDLGYIILSSPNQSLNFVLMRGGIIENTFSNISTTSPADLIAFHSLSQSPHSGNSHGEDFICFSMRVCRSIYFK